MKAPRIRIVDRLASVDAEAWDACAGRTNPFVRHGFLRALEESGSATADAGWWPQHLLLESEDGLLGAAPAYLKSHSYGEYVFDHGWATAYERAGGRYYPKLQVAVPFTPVPGPRLLIRPDADRDQVATALIDGLEAVARAHRLSSAHATFAPVEDLDRFEAAGWLRRLGCQYHWQNHGYASFDGFLEQLAARKRKAIRKERRAVLDAGIEIVTLTGDELQPEHWDAFYRFYRNTTDRKWGAPYLTRRFFATLGATFAEHVVLVLARRDGRWIAGALNLIGTDALYGRNWGAIEEVPFLHFELCYYRAIEFAIERGLARVEAGAQGEHKIQRGYLPVAIESAHWIADPGFRSAIAEFLQRERRAVTEEMGELMRLSPFREETEPV